MKLRLPALRPVLYLTTVSVSLGVSAAWGADASPDHIRTAATRAVELLQASQKNWYAHENCTSCHHQSLPSLAYRSAREHGIPVNEAIAHADAARAFSYEDLDRAVQYNYVIEPAMDDAMRMWGADAAGVKPNLVTAIYARLIAARQNPDGSWDSFHQRPPQAYSRFTETALVAHAITLYGHPSQKADVQARVAKARRWLLSHQPPDTESRTFQLLGLSWTGASRAELDKSARALEATQQDDGGWSSLDGRASDAYSTGEALVALHDAEAVPILDARWQRGIEFLLKTQAPDGSWHVASRLHPPAPVSPPYIDSGYPYGHDQFISSAGASWAIMALARALGPARKAAPPPLPEAYPKNLEPWVETVLFGTTSDLKRLLDKGLDPNSATKSGETTALMMAAPDVTKMKLLLDHGAKVNARSKTKYSALMVAAQYRDASPAIRLLLDRGAEVKLPPDQGKALFRAYPLFLAAYAGNAEILPRLHAAGDSLTDSMVLIGTSATFPLTGVARYGNLEVARTLLDLGAPVDQPEGSGITPLDRAVLGNQVEMAKLLISRGADVNHLDKLGMTPLLYAASIDFGDSGMIDLLLKSGASPDARNKQGMSALELAKKYDHTHLLASLEKAEQRGTPQVAARK